MRVKALASGSSGNAYLVQSGPVALLLEAGLSAMALEEALHRHQITAGQLLGILVSHEHSDHAMGARPLARRWKVPILASTGTLAALVPGTAEQRRRPQRVPMHPLQALQPHQIAPFTITAFPVPHDAIEPMGFLIEAEGWRVCLATDLGMVPAALQDALGQADLLILEANHDVEMLRNGSYPADLKARILSRDGHLSNDDCAAVVAEVCTMQRDTARCVWLAHLSEQNNTPQRARLAVVQALQQAGVTQQVTVDVVARQARGWLGQEWRATDTMYVQQGLW